MLGWIGCPGGVRLPTPHAATRVGVDQLRRRLLVTVPLDRDKVQLEPNPSIATTGTRVEASVMPAQRRERPQVIGA